MSLLNDIERSVRPGRLAAGILALAAVLPFVPAATGDFVVDDVRFVARNHALDRPDVFRRAFTDPAVISSSELGPDWRGIYRPLRTVAYALERRLGGGAAWFHHLAGFGWHFVATLAAWALLRRLLGAERPALFGAILFAVHPAQVESVAWISSRGDVMAGAFALTSLVLFLRGSALGWIAGGVTFVVALLAKESAIAVPFLLALLLVHERPRGTRLRALRPVAALVVVVIAYLVLRQQVLDAAGNPDLAQRSRWGGTFGGSALTMARAAVHYVQVLLLPANLHFGYHAPQPRAGEVPADAVFLLIGILGALAWATRDWLRGGRIGLGVLWIAVGLAPVSNLAVTINIPSAERFLYLSVLGLALIAGDVARRRVRGEPAAARRWALAAGALVLLLGVLSFHRSFDWRTETSLWEASVHDPATGRGGGTPTSHQALYHFAYREYERGEAAAQQGNLEEAERRFGEALRLARLADATARRYAAGLYWPFGPYLTARLEWRLSVHCGHDLWLDALEGADEIVRRAGLDYAPGPMIRGLVAMDLGLYEDAAYSFTMAHQIAPAVPNHRVNLITALGHAAAAVANRPEPDAYAEGIRIARYSASLDPNPQTNPLMKQLQDQLDARYQVALDEAASAARRAGEDPARSFVVANAHMRFAEYERAEEILDRIQEGRPSDPDVALARARLLRLRGTREDLDASLDLYLSLMRWMVLPPSGAYELGLLHAAFADLEREAQNVPRAIGHCRRGLDILSQGPAGASFEWIALQGDLHRRAGSILAEEGDPENASKAWRVASQLYERARDELGPDTSPRLAWVSRKLAVTLDDLGEHADAAAEYRRYLGARGDRPPPDARWAEAKVRRMESMAREEQGG